MDRYRIGIVGCGEVTQIVHLPSIAQLPGQFTVTALCDVSRQVLDAVGERWQVQNRFTDYHDLAASPEVDAVLIANPNAYHAPVTLAALEAGKHVLVEKPMCINLREADEIIAAQKRSGKCVQVGYMRRYAPAFTEAVRQVQELGGVRLARVHDVIGQNALIIRATSNVMRGGDTPAEAVEDNRRMTEALMREAIGDAPPDVRSAYGLLLGLSSHDISAMRELLGRPKGVLYAAQRMGGRYITAAFDYGDFICQFETGVDNIPRYDTTLEVYGADRVLRVQYDTPYVLNLPIRLHVTEANSTGGVDERAVNPTWGDAFLNEWKAFYEAITGKCEPKTSPEDFRQDLEIFLEMVEKMKA